MVHVFVMRSFGEEHYEFFTVDRFSFLSAILVIIVCCYRTGSSTIIIDCPIKLGFESLLHCEIHSQDHQMQHCFIVAQLAGPTLLVTN